MSMANLYLRALSSPGPDQPKFCAAVIDWDLEVSRWFCLLRLPVSRELHAPDKVAGRLGGQLDNFLVIICFQACQGCT